MQKYGRGVRLHAKKGGLLYVGLFTQDKSGIKAATSQRGAFKKAKIPIKEITSGNMFKVMVEAEHLLTKTLFEKGKTK